MKFAFCYPISDYLYKRYPKHFYILAHDYTVCFDNLVISLVTLSIMWICNKPNSILNLSILILLIGFI